jgi:Rrf2 family protein
MQIALGRKGDYSVRAVLDIARNSDGGLRKAREIAEAMDVPARYLTQILAELVHHGLLTAVAGPTGGYSLARTPNTITLLDVAEAAEGPIALDQCVLSGGPCEWDEVCPIHLVWVRAQEALKEQLSATTFADLAGIAAEIEAGTFQLPEGMPLHPIKARRGIHGREDK